MSDIGTLTRRADFVSAAVVLFHLGFAAVPIYAAAVLGPSLWTILLWLWLGVALNGLVNLLHEAAHRHVFGSAAANELLGLWILGPLFLTDFAAYRASHWTHHREVGRAGDTKDAYLVSVAGWAGARFVGWVLAGGEALRKFRHATKAARQVASGPMPVVRLLIFHSGLAGTLFIVAWLSAQTPMDAVIAFTVAYGFVYLYGMATWTILLAALRAIAEHQRLGPDDALVGRAALRNLRCGPLARLIFGCYGFAEHATHHRWPNVPSYRLGQLTRERGVNDPTLLARETYWQVLRRAVTVRPT